MRLQVAQLLLVVVAEGGRAHCADDADPRRADLALGAAGLEQVAAVDAVGELRVVVEDAVHSQHVRDEVVGEQRERGDVGGGQRGLLPEHLHHRIFAFGDSLHGSPSLSITHVIHFSALNAG